MKKTIYINIFVIFLLLFSGCSTTVLYQCQDSSVVSVLADCPEMLNEQECSTIDCADCPQIKCSDLDCSSCPVQIETKEVIKYQCSDGTIKNSADLCPVSEIDNPIDGLTINGNGDEITKSFYLKKGLVRFHAEHKGNSNFMVDLYAESGNGYFLVNEIGRYSGEFIEIVDYSENYFMDVTADGSWTIIIN